ncbi:hypothetical protein WBG99_28885 [Streptomyces sp. TG1A-60]|uniref:hypothetical protein n=1 Tax=Streptomyces sp. TG1A-60 TaxID=3129111 RepID=UPI0030D33D99
MPTGDDEASAPSEEQIEDGADKSAVEHGGHGDYDAPTHGPSAPRRIPPGPAAGAWTRTRE